MWTDKMLIQMILFIVVKASEEPLSLFGWADNKRMVHQNVTDSPNKTPQVVN